MMEITHRTTTSDNRKSVKGPEIEKILKKEIYFNLLRNILFNNPIV